MCRDCSYCNKIILILLFVWSLAKGDFEFSTFSGFPQKPTIPYENNLGLMLLHLKIISYTFFNYLITMREGFTVKLQTEGQNFFFMRRSRPIKLAERSMKLPALSSSLTFCFLFLMAGKVQIHVPIHQ